MLQRIQRIRCTKPTFEERRMIMTMKDYIRICKIIYKYKKYIQKSTLEERRMHRRHLLMFSHRNSARLCGKNQRIILGNISIIVKWFLLLSFFTYWGHFLLQSGLLRSSSTASTPWLDVIHYVQSLEATLFNTFAMYSGSPRITMSIRSACLEFFPHSSFSTFF